MKFQISKNFFLQNLKTSCNFTDNTGLTPIGSSILIEANEGILKLTTINNNTSSSLEIKQNIKIEKEGKILIKGRLLYNILSKLPEQEINFEAVDNSVLRIKSQNFSSDINLLDAHLFPMPNFNYVSWAQTSIPTSFVLNIINKLIPCATTFDNKNIACNAILLDSTRISGFIEAIGTDGNHLAYIKQPYQGNQLKIIFPIQVLRYLTEILNQENINLFFNNKNVIFKSDNLLLLVRTLEGEYPNLTKSLESANPNKIIIPTTSLLNAIEKATILTANEKKPAIQVNVNGDMLKTTVRSIDYGSAIEEIHITNSTNSSASFIFNAKYLTNLIKNITTPNTIIEFSSERKPVFLKEENNNNYISLLLTIMNF